MTTTPDPHAPQPSDPESSAQSDAKEQGEDDVSQQMKALARALTVHSLWEKVGLLKKKDQ